MQKYTRLILFLILIALISISVLMARKTVEDFAANIAAELIGILITVVIIDWLIERRSSELMKNQLVRQAGSSDNGLALGAIRELDHHGWLRKSGLFENAWLRKADLSEAVLFGIDFSGSQAEGAKFVKCDLVNTVFRKSDLRKASFNEANLLGSTFEADLYKGTFIDANLQQVKFEKSRLDYASLNRSNLQGADLSNTSLVGTVLNDAKFDKKTKWPQNFEPTSKGAVLTDKIGGKSVY